MGSRTGGWKAVLADGEAVLAESSTSRFVTNVVFITGKFQMPQSGMSLKNENAT